MTAHSFQFRECLNPDCGLRYPLIDRNQFGERCPVCLSETKAVAEGRLTQESGDGTEQAADSGLEVVVDNVRSAWNVGSMFRSAEGFGIRRVYLCGISATPEHDEVKKTALGAQDIVIWSAHKNAVKLVNDLKAAGKQIWALEGTVASQSLDDLLRECPAPNDLVLVVGNEQTGIDPGVLELADQVVHIEMHGRKQSFNVAVAFAVAAHAITRTNPGS